jgi:hypothetical protein
VAAVAVVAGAWVVIRAVGADGVGGGSASGGSASGTLDDAVRCKQTLVRGRDLICVTPPSTLTDLPPAERDARLARARALAVLAGMNRIIFEYNGRIWRTLVLTAPQGTTTTAPSGTPATATPGPAGTPVSSPSPPASPVGPVDTTAP